MYKLMDNLANLMIVPCCHLLPGDFFFPLLNDQPVGEKATIRLNRPWQMSISININNIKEKSDTSIT